LISIGLKLRIPSQRFSKPFIFVGQDTGQGVEQARSELAALVLSKVERESSYLKKG
jgi:hypothetical protein